MFTKCLRKPLKLEERSLHTFSGKNGARGRRQNRVYKKISSGKLKSVSLIQSLSRVYLLFKKKVCCNRKKIFAYKRLAKIQIGGICDLIPYNAV